VLWTAVPKTTIHKHGKFYMEKNKIRISEHHPVTPPACDVMTPKKSYGCQFSRFVSSSSDTRHQVGAF
jgi:hypothetical protein